jgi:hypothetical protein
VYISSFVSCWGLSLTSIAVQAKLADARLQLQEEQAARKALDAQLFSLAAEQAAEMQKHAPLRSPAD